MIGFAISFFVGALGVMQNTLNKQFSASLGLARGLLVNSLVLCACAVAVLIWVRVGPDHLVPPLLRSPPDVRSLRVWDVLPGLFGFAIIAMCPLLIDKLGATRVFIAIIAAQLVMSMLWDWGMESLPPTALRLAGGALALAGAILAVL